MLMHYINCIRTNFEYQDCWSSILDKYFRSISMFDRMVEHSDVIWKSWVFDIMYVLLLFHNNAKVITSYISYTTRSCRGRKEYEVNQIHMFCVQFSIFIRFNTIKICKWKNGFLSLMPITNKQLRSGAFQGHTGVRQLT